MKVKLVEKLLKEGVSKDELEEVLSLIGEAHDKIISAQDALSDLYDDYEDNILDAIEFDLDTLEAELSEVDFMGNEDPVQSAYEHYGEEDNIDRDEEDADFVGAEETEDENVDEVEDSEKNESIKEEIGDHTSREYKGIKIFANELSDGLTSVTAQWIVGGGKYGKAEPSEKIYRTKNLSGAIDAYINNYLDDFISKGLRDSDVHPNAYWD